MFILKSAKKKNEKYQNKIPIASFPISHVSYPFSPSLSPFLSVCLSVFLSVSLSLSLSLSLALSKELKKQNSI